LREVLEIERDYHNFNLRTCQRSASQLEIARRLDLDYIVLEKFSHLHRWNWAFGLDITPVDKVEECAVFENTSFVVLRVEKRGYSGDG